MSRHRSATRRVSLLARVPLLIVSIAALTPPGQAQEETARPPGPDQWVTPQRAPIVIAPQLSEPTGLGGAPVAPSPSAAPGAFVLGPGDELKVTVWGYPEISEQVVILPDGTVSYPLIGSLQAAGLTVQQLAGAISRALESQIRAPKVSLIVTQLRSRQFSIVGEVERPGSFSLWSDQLSVLEAVAQAGGLKPTAIAQEIELLRPAGAGQPRRSIPVDLTAVVGQHGRGATATVTVQPGDVVYVPTQLGRPKISVLGEVNAPGLYAPSLAGGRSATVLETLAQAGGLKPSAVPQEITILRSAGPHQPRRVILVNLAAALERQNPSLVPEVRPGDVVYVPSQAERRKVCVLGEVVVPGLYPLAPRMSVVEALSAAGWAKPSGVLSSVMVVRRAETGQQRVFQLNAQRIISKQDWSQDLALEPGDIVYVPEHVIAKIGDFVSFFTSKVEPAAHTYLRIYDATNPANVIVDR